jgi:hypothetical protein
LHPLSHEGHNNLESWAVCELSEPASNTGQADTSADNESFEKPSSNDCILKIR